MLPLLPTTVIGSYSFPSWLGKVRELGTAGTLTPQQVAEAHDAAVRAVIHDQELAGVDIITDGEIRRALLTNDAALQTPCGDAMNRTPRVVRPDRPAVETLHKATVAPKTPERKAAVIAPPQQPVAVVKPGMSPAPAGGRIEKQARLPSAAERAEAEYRRAVLAHRQGSLEQAAASLRAEVAVEVPEGGVVERVEIYLNETRVATLYQEPYVQPIVLPPGEPVAYVRAVAYLPDGNSTEDAVFINAPDYLDEVDVQFVEVYATVLDRWLGLDSQAVLGAKFPPLDVLQS